MPTPKRTPSTSELALKAQLESDEVPARRNTRGEPVEVNAPYAVKGNDTSAYVGVDPSYMTYASDTEKPLRADGGVEAQVEEMVLDGSKFGVAAKKETGVDADTTQVGSGSSSDSIYTAYSGEGFTAEKVVAKPAEEPADSTPVEEPPAPVAPADQKAASNK